MGAERTQVPPSIAILLCNPGKARARRASDGFRKLDAGAQATSVLAWGSEVPAQGVAYNVRLVIGCRAHPTGHQALCRAKSSTISGVWFHLHPRPLTPNMNVEMFILLVRQ